MNNLQPGVNLYQQTAIQSTPPEKLLLMLYDGAIRFLNLAKEAYGKRDFEGINVNLQKAQNIITELMVTLNMDYDISKNLYKLYEYYNHRLVQANIRKDLEPINEVLEHLTGLREAWAQAELVVRKESGQGRLEFAV